MVKHKYRIFKLKTKRRTLNILSIILKKRTYRILYRHFLFYEMMKDIVELRRSVDVVGKSGPKL